MVEDENDEIDISELTALLFAKRLVALTGAGMSTESGIPDYRGPETRRRARNPVQYRAFVSDPEARRHYWSRAVVGWGRFSGARPNPGHEALATLERAGHLEGVITQNVDRLHHEAGSDRVVELHGALTHVRCLGCDAVSKRSELQSRLLTLNPGWAEHQASLAPDGDADLETGAVASFRVAACALCGGALKPDVVFFGENCRPEVVEDAWSLFDQAEALLVVGTSLAVFSGYRFVRRAQERRVPIAMINLGSARGEEHAAVRIEGKSGEVLPRLLRALGALGAQ